MGMTIGQNSSASMLAAAAPMKGDLGLGLGCVLEGNRNRNANHLELNSCMLAPASLL